jgi:hypothetical protein
VHVSSDFFETYVFFKIFKTKGAPLSSLLHHQSQEKNVIVDKQEMIVPSSQKMSATEQPPSPKIRLANQKSQI